MSDAEFDAAKTEEGRLWLEYTASKAIADEIGQRWSAQMSKIRKEEIRRDVIAEMSTK